MPQKLIVLTLDDIRLTAEAGWTMGTSEEKIEYGDGLRSEDNLFRAAQEGSVRRFEDEGIK